MSTLTKLFVVLLIVVSLLLSAGTVVFVGQVTDYKEKATIAQQEVAGKTAAANTARAEAEAARATAQEQISQVTQQLEEAKKLNNTLQQQMIEKDTQLAAAQSQGRTQTVENLTLAGGLKAAQDTQSRLQEQLGGLQGSNDKLVTQNAQLNQSVTDLTNKWEVTERERKLLAEQLTESKNQVQKQAAMLRDAGVSTAQFASAGSRVGAPAINGVIRDVRPIQGVLYASISVGAADSVTKGMEFRVISKDTNTFLGVLTVERVELNEATGRLSGPHMSEIQKGAEVKTQF